MNSGRLGACEELVVRYIKLDEGIPEPCCMREGDGALDLRSVKDLHLEPFGRALVPTGIAIELPKGYSGFVLPRSGLALKKGLSLVNSPGLIDSNYRGEICAIVINLDPENPIEINRGERIAQLAVVKTEQVALVLSGGLSDSERGTAGFGSSGVE